VPAAPQILRSFLRGQTLRGFNPQKNPAKDLASGSPPPPLEEPRKDGPRSRVLLKEIWPQVCEKPDAQNVRFESPLASHRPVAKSPLGATVPFLQFLSQPPVLWGSLWVSSKLSPPLFRSFLLALFLPLDFSLAPLLWPSAWLSLPLCPCLVSLPVSFSWCFAFSLHLNLSIAWSSFDRVFPTPLSFTIFLNQRNMARNTAHSTVS